jgi:tryptophan halogenase
MNNIVILGGGSAGYITAIFARKLFANAKITLIESKEIGIVGVGEASTPHLVNFFKEHNIDPLEVIQKTNGTIKNGINFVNWNGDGKAYFHDFFEHLESFSIQNVYDNGCEDFFKKLLINNNLDFKDYIYQQKLAYGNKIDLEKTNYAMHFDSVKLANFLESVARSRNIDIIDDVLNDPMLDDNGFIKSLKFKSERVIDCDFVFDCSGFSRVLIGKLYQSKWKSYSNFLPAKKAIPFWLEHKQDPRPYTDSIAMKNGCMRNE